MNTINGSDLLVSILGKAVGHCTSHQATFSTETNEISVKPKQSEKKKAASLFKNKTVTGLKVQVKADALICYGEDETGFRELYKAWAEGQSVDVALFERDYDTTPYYKGKMTISSLDKTAGSGENAKYSVTLDNDGAPEVCDYSKFDNANASNTTETTGETSNA
jgi:hypothetical protein